MKKTHTLRNVLLIFLFLMLLLGLWGFYLPPAFLTGLPFFVAWIYATLVMVLTVWALVTTVRDRLHRKEKEKQIKLQTSFGTEDARQMFERRFHRLSQRLGRLHGFLSLALSLLFIATGIVQGLYHLFADILTQGGSVNLQVYFKLGDTLRLFQVLVFVLFVLLIAALTTHWLLALRFKRQRPTALPSKTALEAPNVENEEIPDDPASVPFEAFETAKKEPKVEPEANPASPKVLEDSSRDKIHPENVMPPKEETSLTAESLQLLQTLMDEVEKKVAQWALPHPSTFTPLPGLPNVAWVQEDALFIYFDYASKRKSVLEECLKHDPKKFPLSDIEKVVLEGPSHAELCAFYYHENKELHKLLFPKDCLEVLTRLIGKENG